MLLIIIASVMTDGMVADEGRTRTEDPRADESMPCASWYAFHPYFIYLL